jgi:hypothetical protein
MTIDFGHKNGKNVAGYCARHNLYFWSTTTCPQCSGAVALMTAPQKREGTTFVPLPEGVKTITSAIVFNGKLLIACDNHTIYYRTDDGRWAGIWEMGNETTKPAD